MATLKISLINDQGETIEARAIKTTDVVAAVLYGELDAVLSKMDRKLEKTGVPKSEQLEQKAAQEDNDLKALGIYNQALREKRVERWEDWKEKILNSPSVLAYDDYPAQGKIRMLVSKPHEEEKYEIDYYPKANKVHILKFNKWEAPGLRWLIKNFYLP